MNKMKNSLILAASVLACTALTACGNDASDVVNLLESAVSTSSTETSETTAVSTDLSLVTTSAFATSTETSAAVTTTAIASDSTAATTAAVTEAPATAANNDQQQTQAPAANNDTPAQTAAPNTPPASTTAPPAQTPATETNMFDALHVETDCSAYIASHTGYRMEEAASCIGSGVDRTYTYSNYTLITYVENGTEILKEIDLTGAGITTRKGLSVGSSAADVEQAYGAPVGGLYTYSTADGTVDFMIDGGTVTLIAIYS